MFGGGIEKKSILLSDSYDLFCAAPTISGAHVNATTALRVPAVYSAIALVGGALGSLPCKVFNSSPEGKRAADDHPAYKLVHRRANDWTSAGELRAKLTQDALLNDNGGFALANRISGGRVYEFIRLDPRTVTVKTDEASGEPFYEERRGNRVLRHDFRDMLHVTPPADIAPINAGREAIGLSMILEREAARRFASGARPSAVLTSTAVNDSERGKTNRDTLRNSFRRWRTDDSDTPLILEGHTAYKEIGAMSSVDAQFLEMRIEQINEIARLFRVPPHLLFELSRATWSNAEEMFQSFLTLTLRAWLDKWEWAYTRVLLTPEEHDADHYVEFVIDDLLTANAATRATVYAQYRSMGALTANEVRAGLNRPAMAGGDTLSNPNITPGKPAGENDDASPKVEAA